MSLCDRNCLRAWVLSGFNFFIIIFLNALFFCFNNYLWTFIWSLIFNFWNIFSLYYLIRLRTLVRSVYNFFCCLFRFYKILSINILFSLLSNNLWWNLFFIFQIGTRSKISSVSTLLHLFHLEFAYLHMSSYILNILFLFRYFLISFL